MRLIRGDCRSRLSASDLDFVVSVLGEGTGEMDALVKLLSDGSSRDVILDNGKLVDALQDRPEWPEISAHLYFYLLVRHSMRARGLGDRPGPRR